MILKLLIHGTTIMMALGCQRTFPEIVYHTSSAKKHYRLGSKLTESPVIWKKGGFHLTTSSTLNPKSLMMVQTSQALPKDENIKPILTMTLPNLETYQLVRLNTQSQDSISSLAAWSHSQGFGCGGLQRLSTLTLTSNTSVIPPRYNPQVKLEEVQNLMDSITSTHYRETIESLEALGTRFHTTDSGKQASDLIFQLFSNSGKDIPGFSVERFEHSSSDQKSIIAKIPGDTNPEITVIVGAHLDSINSRNNLDAPGADDDASGIASLVAILKSLSKARASFEYSVELHAYAAEEVGLLGSSNISQTYLKQNRSVAGMLQIDMVNYFPQGSTPAIYLVTTDTHRNVTYDLKGVVETYLNIPFFMAPLKRGTSDHKSWSDRGYPSGFAFENPENFNPHLHTKDDLLSFTPDLSQAVYFGKLAIGFISHYAGLKSAKLEAQVKEGQLFSDNSGSDILPIAIYEDSQDLYYISVTSNLALSYLNLCKFQKNQGPSCISTRVNLSRDGQINSRNNFTTDSSIPLSEGDTLRIMAYSSDHKLVGYRSIRLLSKTSGA